MINIYGDSYSDYVDESLGPLEWSSWFKNEPSWLGLVDKELERINVHSKGGESTYNLLRSLQADLPNENDRIIFLLTERTRIPFPFLEKSCHTGAAEELYRRSKNGENIDDVCKNAEEGEGYEIGGAVYNNIEKIIGAYDTFEYEIKMWPFYVCLFLKWLNRKTLVLTTDAKIFEDIPYDWTTLNDSNFKIVDTQLEQVCHNEFHDRIIRDEIERERINHLSYENHKTLYNIISNFFLGTKLSEKFHENLYHIKDGEEIKRFIYD